MTKFRDTGTLILMQLTIAQLIFQVTFHKVHFAPWGPMADIFQKNYHDSEGKLRN